MIIYIAGICGTGMGPLALLAKEAGMRVYGSDQAEGAVSEELKKAGVDFAIGNQDGKYLKKLCEREKIDWLVHSSALTPEHPELVAARELGIRISKRDELVSYLIEKLKLKMVAVAGTHGKTTTTAMVIWTCLQLGIPVSYLVGTTMPFAVAGKYDKAAQFLVYEADEYDRNFLHFHPWLTGITTVSYDHPDIYPQRADYLQAFQQFEEQSGQVLKAEDNSAICVELNLAGATRRQDAALATALVRKMAEQLTKKVSQAQIVAVLNRFPGVGRRFERVAPQVYSDYAHHPEEISATIGTALEENKRLGLAGVVAVYEPHQNSRQYEIKSQYGRVFCGVEKLFWLPTYLVREDPKLTILQPDDFIKGLANQDLAESAELGQKLAEKLHQYIKRSYLILLMTAGPADSWLRRNLAE